MPPPDMPLSTMSLPDIIDDTMSSSEANTTSSYAASSYYLPYEHALTNEEIDNISKIKIDFIEGI